MVAAVLRFIIVFDDGGHAHKMKDDVWRDYMPIWKDRLGLSYELAPPLYNAKSRSEDAAGGLIIERQVHETRQNAFHGTSGRGSKHMIIMLMSNIVLHLSSSSSTRSALRVCTPWSHCNIWHCFKGSWTILAGTIVPGCGS
jgi:hypothetical protein